MSFDVSDAVVVHVALTDSRLLHAMQIQVVYINITIAVEVTVIDAVVDVVFAQM